MDVSVETLTGLETRLTITLPSETVEERLDVKLNEAKSKARLPGFRPGKIPLKEIRRRFGPSLRAELASEGNKPVTSRTELVSLRDELSLAICNKFL